MFSLVHRLFPQRLTNLGSALVAAKSVQPGAHGSCVAPAPFAACTRPSPDPPCASLRRQRYEGRQGVGAPSPEGRHCSPVRSAAAFSVPSTARMDGPRLIPLSSLPVSERSDLARRSHQLLLSGISLSTLCALHDD